MDNENQIVNDLIELKTENDDLQVEYEIMAWDSEKSLIDDAIQELDKRILADNKKLVPINEEIDRLTNHADGIDYSVAVACGVLTGLIDVFFVGEFDFVGSREKVGEKFDELVKKKANELREKEVKEKANQAVDKAKKAALENGKKFTEADEKKIRESICKKIQEPLDKEKSIKFLEERFNIPSDSVYEKTNEQINKIIKETIEKANSEGNPLSSKQIKELKEKLKTKISDKSHHLDDLTHHPSVIGLAASIVQQFTEKAVFQNRDGKNIPIKVDKVKKVKHGKEEIEIVLIGEDLKSKLFCGVVNWVMHLLSDAAGSSGSAKRGNEGMGLPGPIMSLLKEISMIPGLNKTSLPEKLYELFTKEQDFLGGYTLDLRSELAIGAELGKQAIPVFINTIFVRCFYFVRHFAQEVKANNGFDGLDFRAAIKRSAPFKNRTVIRMLTVSLGTFEAIDLGDAAIHGAIKSGGTLPGFLASFLLRVNFVGIGRFTIAVASDIKMGIQRERYRNSRSLIIQDMIIAYDAKMYYKLADVKLEQAQMYMAESKMYVSEANMWKQVENTEKSINDMLDRLGDLIGYYSKTINQMNEKFDDIEEDIIEIRECDSDFTNELLSRLK
ncbi:MAG: hypothetical protein K6A74_04915 [Lachnospiraceae bacterium]|nr:hypothetical protein [Lachnospiraceae bacterium]